MKLYTFLFLFTILYIQNTNGQSIASTFPIITNNWELYDSQDYSISYPSNWDFEEIATDGGFVILSPLSSEYDDFRENVNLLIQDLSSYNLNLDQFIKLSENQIKEQRLIENSILISSEKKNNTFREFQKIIYSGKLEGMNFKFEAYTWVLDNKAYILTLTTKINEFDNYQKLGEKILDSFKIHIK